MSSKSERQRLAVDLKTWLRSQNRFRTVREVAAAAGIPYTSVKDYFNGRSAPQGERRQILADLTRLSALRGQEKPVPIRKDPSGSATARADAVLQAVRQLLVELDPFKAGTPEERVVLRKTVPARDIGYLTALLKAMYDEDQFQTWLYFTEYKPEGR
jgi:hypothetical protein